MNYPIRYECPRCFGLTDLAARKMPRLACKCPTDDELDARDAALRLTVATLTGDAIEIGVDPLTGRARIAA